MARNACGLALLVALALAGCSRFSNKEEQEAKASEAKLAVLRARTDSLRKARHLADSLIQVRQAACVDSVKIELARAAAFNKPKKIKKSKKQQTPPMSEEAMLTQAQAACGSDASVPQPSVAVQPAPAPATATPAKADTQPMPAPARPDSAKPHVADAAMPSSGTQPAAAVAATDSLIWADSVRKAKEIEMSRETFSYGGAARDPFISLLNLAKSGPELADLQLVGIYQNLRNPSGSVAVFREKEGGKRHKLRAGDQVGRSRLVQIRDRDVVFMIEDFGFERQETLSLRKQEDVIP
ncbi:MAG TPA: hypothetical protein VFH40_00480 [Gemmatimonadales bacterium]|nr:hypothetical protein [Gemmatimonadales bacterium]